MLLMIVGAPPSGIKFYGKDQRLYVKGMEASQWVTKVEALCLRGIDVSGFMSHYRPNYRLMLAKNMKNHFVRWCRDAGRTEIQKTGNG